MRREHASDSDEWQQLKPNSCLILSLLDAPCLVVESCYISAQQRLHAHCIRSCTHLPARPIAIGFCQVQSRLVLEDCGQVPPEKVQRAVRGDIVFAAVGVQFTPEGHVIVDVPLWDREVA